jgi:hypothetical protein
MRRRSWETRTSRMLGWRAWSEQCWNDRNLKGESYIVVVIVLGGGVHGDRVGIGELR